MKNKTNLRLAFQFLEALFTCADKPQKNELTLQQRIEALKNKAKKNINPKNESR